MVNATLTDEPGGLRHVAGAPFKGYNYGCQREGGEAYRLGLTLHANPYKAVTQEGERSSWRYGWLIEQRNYERFEQAHRYERSTKLKGWLSLVSVISAGIVGAALAWALFQIPG